MKRVPLALALALVVAGCTANSDFTGVDGEIIPIIDPVLIDASVGALEWAGSLAYAGTFVIDEGSPYAGQRPFELRIAREANALVLGVVIHEVDSQPFTEPDGPWYPHKLRVYLAQSEALSRPSDAVSIDYTQDFNATQPDDGYWDGRMWVVQNSMDLAGEDGGRHRRFAAWMDNRTFTAEARIPATSPLEEWDGFQVKGPTPIHLDLQFGVQLGAEEEPGRNESIRVWGHVVGMDNWPGEGQNMWGHVDPRGWLRLRWE